MNESDIKKLFDNTAQIPVDENAKQQAIAAAMAEFSAVQAQKSQREQKNGPRAQGFLTRLRLTFSSNKSNRRKDMQPAQWLQQKWFLGGLATACVAVLGVMLVTNNPHLITASTPDAIVQKTPQATPQPPTAPKEFIVEEIVVADTQTPRPNNALRESYEMEAEPDAAGSAVFSAPPHKSAKLAATLHAEHKRLISAPETPLSDYQEEGRDRFTHFATHSIKLTREEPVSTLSIDVDTASYSFVRRQLNSGVLPQKDAVRLEEMVNYFDYAYPVPTAKNEPFSRTVSVIDSPWHAEKKLIHIGIKGYELIEQPKSNLVFLLDVSGSMNSPDKLPLVKQSMNLLLSQLRPDDTVAIAVYAGAAGTVLEPTKVKDKQKIINALTRLQAGGSTAGAEGIKLAYQLAEAAFQKDAVNRIILATDGDFNVGIANPDELKGFVERKRESGIFLSVLGFGSGNYHDKLMQDLAQNGNGIAAYIDSLSEAQKVLVNEATSSLFPIANDVKIQVEFNPAAVAEYRLLGYETRALKREDFNNDKVDAGDIGAGHTVTAIYEITPVKADARLVDESRYSPAPSSQNTQQEYAFLKMRYKLPHGKTSQLLTSPIAANTTQPSQANARLLREAHFATAVAGFAQLLKDAKYTGDWQWDDAIALAQANKGEDLYGYRTEFVQLIRKAQTAAAMR